MFAAIVGQSWATAAHPYGLEINGLDVIGDLIASSLVIDMAGPGDNGSMTFRLQDTGSAYSIAAWDEVRFHEHAATRPILFGGFVQSVRYIAWETTGRMIEVRCVGYGVLLDKRVVPEFPLPPVYNGAVCEVLVGYINRHGGMLSAASYVDGSTGYTSATLSIPRTTGVSWTYDRNGWSWAWDPMTLRAFIDRVVSGIRCSDSGVYTGTYGPASASYWVDGAGRVMVLPDFPADIDAAGLPYQYDGGTVPGLTVDLSGTLRVTGATYETEDIDRLSSVYVKGPTAGTTGWVRVPAPRRAGDLESVASDSTIADSAARDATGSAAIKRTEGATARGSADVYSETPLDIWPGRNVRVTVPALGLASADWRITSVRIVFHTSTARTYSVGFGGNAPAPSMARRQGRFARR